MTTTTQGKHGAYAAHQRQTENSREVDARALLSCAARMQALLDAGVKDADGCADAVRQNQRLWTIFQVAVCDPDNPLPKDLKMMLLNLSRYIDRTSFRIIGEFSPEHLKSLVEINRAVASGLSRKPPNETPPPVLSQTGAPTQLMTSA